MEDDEWELISQRGEAYINPITFFKKEENKMTISEGYLYLCAKRYGIPVNICNSDKVVLINW